MLPPIIIFAIILSILIFIHELGHFVSARKFGVDVEEFGIGIPPRLWGKKIGRTIYSLNWLPLGGFVKIKGEDFEGYDPKDKSNFINKKPWQKAVVLLAGIFMNLMLAFIIFYFVLGMNGFKSNPILLITDYEFPYGETVQMPNVITYIEADGPADVAGVQFADRIVTAQYGDQTVNPMSTQDVRDFLADKEGVEVLITVKNINTGNEIEYMVIPKYSDTVDGPAIGIAMGEAVQLTYVTPTQKLLAGPYHSGNVLGYSLFALKGLIASSFETKDVGALSRGVAGPVGIFGAVKNILETGGPNVWYVLLDLVAILSLSLAFMNLLPIPALDGGRLVFVVAEWITGKRPSPKLEAVAHQIGFVFLIGLLLLITLKDYIVFF